MVKRGAVAALTASLLSGACVAYAGQQMPMSFFVTSVGIGKGGDLGGLQGADAHCQMLAAAAGSTGKTWRAYLSTQARPGQPAVNARDRIGTGPWYNAKGQPISLNQAELHGDTLELAQRGSNLFKQSALTEKGQVVPGAGDTGNMHDVLTGSQLDGRAYTDNMDHTCNNWSSSTMGSAQVATRGCSQADLQSTGGAGLFYCFAIN